ncbi:MAG: tRNA dihydrouridine(20/20a) synthase DusA [Elstera sp.]
MNTPALLPIPDSRTPLSVAPMIDWTDRHFRFFLRQITRHSRLYTEMITSAALKYGDKARHLDFDAAEHPIALQLGGADPQELAMAARLGADWGYDEINLNVGCPSDRVQSGKFGACLMAEPELVARCVEAMARAVPLPITVKHRLAIDEMDEEETLFRFVSIVREAGCKRFIVHARKAWLKGLSPKENREVPPLRYELVHALKDRFPDLDLSLNGGIRTLDEAAVHLPHLDGVMIGRAAYEDPWSFAEADARFFGGGPGPENRAAVVQAMLPYIERRMGEGVPLKAITRHMLTLFKGQPGGRAWRRYLSEVAHRPGAGPEVVEAALRMTEPGALAA